MMKLYCERCLKTNTALSMSYMNTDTCCQTCLTEEQAHPMYAAAKEAEHKQVVAGNYNYNGLFAGQSWEQIKQATS